MAARVFDKISPRPLLVAIVMSAAWTSPAKAQDIPEGIGVADRQRAEFQPVGGRVGSFFLYPEFDATLQTNSNVFASSAASKSSDIIAIAQPSIDIQSIWSQHALEGSAYYRHSEYFRNDTETVDEYGGDISGRYDFNQTDNLRVRVLARHEAEKRYSLSSDTSSLTPLAYDEVNALMIGTKQFGHIRAEVNASIRSLRYDDNISRSGDFLDGRIRDTTIKTLGMAVKYASGSAVNMFVRVQIEQRDFPFGPGAAGFDPAVNYERDSKGGKIEGGLSFELKDRLYGNVRLGYLFQNYADPRLLDVSNVSYGADLLWNPSRLTSVRVAIDRAVSPVTSTRDAGLFRTRYSAVVSHELRRNLLLTGAAEVSRVEPIGPSAKSRETEFGAGVRYLANRLLSFDLGVVHRARSSSDPQLRYSANIATLSVRVTL